VERGSGRSETPPTAILQDTHSVEGEFCELRIDGVLRRSGGFVLWSIYTPLKQEYTAFVAWLRDRCVKAQDSYLPSYRRRARYLQATKPQ
jgi:hypothetical protein